MEKSLLALDGFIPLVVRIAIFTLLWVVIFKSLKVGHFFRGKAVEAIVAMCVSLLSLIGMFRFLGAGNGTYNVSERTSDQDANLDTILLPYAALGITIILLALYLFAISLFRRDKSRKPLTDIERRPESVSHPNLGKSDKLPEVRAGEALKEIAMRQNNSRSLKLTNRLLGQRVRHSDVRKDRKSNRIKQ